MCTSLSVFVLNFVNTTCSTTSCAVSIVWLYLWVEERTILQFMCVWPRPPGSHSSFLKLTRAGAIIQKWLINTQNDRSHGCMFEKGRVRACGWGWCLSAQSLGVGMYSWHSSLLTQLGSFGTWYGVGHCAMLASSPGHSQVFNVASWKAGEGLVRDGTWVTFHLEPTWNRLNCAWVHSPFCGLPAAILLPWWFLRLSKVISETRLKQIIKSGSS